MGERGAEETFRVLSRILYAQVQFAGAKAQQAGCKVAWEYAYASYDKRFPLSGIGKCTPLHSSPPDAARTWKVYFCRQSGNLAFSPPRRNNNCVCHGQARLLSLALASLLVTQDSSVIYRCHLLISLSIIQQIRFQRSVRTLETRMSKKRVFSSLLLLRFDIRTLRVIT